MTARAPIAPCITPIILEKIFLTLMEGSTAGKYDPRHYIEHTDHD